MDAVIHWRTEQMTEFDLTHEVKKKARELGFEWVGVTTPEPPLHLDTYDRWIEDGRHGSMGYLDSERARQRRGNPLEILTECKSILVLGIPYSHQHLDEVNQGKGRVASYAWGDDYHNILPGRMREIVNFIEEQIGEKVANRWYTDTGPILERELAQRAGIGWIGKNTSLIHPEMGSYYFLAEIFLGVELVPDQPFTTDHCGTCTRCIEACPTQCILPDRTIDARTCISYLTIENKAEIPPDMRPWIGDWVFGCDVCQQVCPWNERFAQHKGDPAFQERPLVARPVLADELGLTPESFNRKFKGSPVKRAKRRGYLRNAVVAAGNQMDVAAVSALVRLLEDTEPLIRGHSAWALGQIGGSQAVNALHQAAISETDEWVRQEIKTALKTNR